MARKKVSEEEVQVVIKAPKLRMLRLRLKGTAPYVQNKFSEKAKQEMMDTQKKGKANAKATGGKKVPKDFDALYKNAMHVSSEGWNGIPASAFRTAAIDACRLIGFKMTLAKMSIFVLPDGFDAVDGTPLVRITKGKPERVDHLVRMGPQGASTDIRPRPMWKTWEVELTVQYDADQFSAQDVTNLLHRVGAQVGVGEGRHFSKNSTGMGWGTFEIVS